MTVSGCSGSPASMSLRRWEFADPRTSRTPRLPAVKGGLISPISARGAKAVKDLRPLAEPSNRSLTERTLEAAEAWSIPGSPFKGLDASHPSRGFELSQDSRSGFFGRLTGLDIEAELQRHAVLLKGLLRDMAVIRDTVWHLADERSVVTSAAHDAKEACDVTTQLRTSFSELEIAVLKQQELWAKDGPGDAKLLQSLQESSMETRYEEQSLREETQFEEHSRILEGRFQEHHGLLNQRLEEHSRILEGRFQEHHGQLNQRFEALMQEHSLALEQYQEQHQTMEERFQEVREKVGNLSDSLRKEVQIRREALRGNVVRDLSASLADEVAERACQSVTPVLQRMMAEARGERPSTCPAVVQGGPAPGDRGSAEAGGVKRVVAIPQALRGNVVRDLSASLADEVAERACQSVTPVLQRMMAEARGERPSTCPAVVQGGTDAGNRAQSADTVLSAEAAGVKGIVMDSEEAQVVAAEVAAELIQMLLTDWRSTPSPQELWP
ncbi:unnamed protein product [Cladocopium goreaui]|uniref:Uncharacterized protein n=1 Tax=Cladocopium goreaui TaxID=2562237 RepID=A0A9P1DWR7_9DINO|nr:unnamed protein product [Cladocopium goreaui]